MTTVRWPRSRPTKASVVLAEPKAIRGEPPSRLVAVSWGAVIGSLSGLTGTGGGILLSPLLVIAGWADLRQTGGVTAAFILADSIAGALGQPLDFESLPEGLTVWLGVAVLGGIIGSELGTRRFKAEAFRPVLGGILLIAGARLLSS